MRILVAGGDAQIRRPVESALRLEGHSVQLVATAEALSRAIEARLPDLVIIVGDTVGGPGEFTNLRRQGCAVPVLALVAGDGPEERAVRLDAGADDCLAIPFDATELLARVRALLRRPPLSVGPVLQLGPLRLDPAAKTVLCRRRVVELTMREYALLAVLMREPGRVFASRELLEHAWNPGYDGASNVVASAIRHLRAKLRASGSPDVIETRRELGYVLRKPD